MSEQVANKRQLQQSPHRQSPPVRVKSPSRNPPPVRIPLNNTEEEKKQALIEKKRKMMRKFASIELADEEQY